MCLISACALALSVVGVGGAAHAQQPPSSVYVRIASDCASLAAEQMLLEEVRMRIPEQTRLRRSGASEAPWHLIWDSEDELGCQLSLSDATPDPVVAIPLTVNSEPGKIREAAVRVAWFISTSIPEEREALPVDAVASVESPLPKTGNPEVIPALDEQPGSELPEFPTSRQPDVSELPEFPSPRAGVGAGISPAPSSAGGLSASSSNELALTLEEPGHPSVLRSLNSTLSTWRKASPGLFGTLSDLGTDPPPAYVLGEPVPLGGYMGVTTELTSFDNSGAFLLSLDGGLIFNERVMLGLVYQRLMNEIDVDDNWSEGELGELSMTQMGVSGAYIFRPRDFMSVSVGSALTVGNMHATRFEQGQANTRHAMFVGSQVNAQAFMEFLPWLDAGVGLNYHFPLIMANSQVLTLDEYNGLSVLFNLRLRIF